MTHFSEEELIAYQLHETSNEAAIQRHIEICSECAATSDSIAETLRVFSAESVPEPDLDRNWQRLRGNLSVLTPEPRRNFFSRFVLWPTAGLAAAALILFIVFGFHIRLSHSPIHKPNIAINGHGPLTTEPTDPAIANHLDAAERLLTEVNHTSGSLDPVTRVQAHDLLLSNAVYTRTAHDHGDYAQAAVLDDLGRVLTTIDNQPPSAHGSTLQLRVEMNTSGLLLDIRILRQNDNHL